MSAFGWLLPHFGDMRSSGWEIDRMRAGFRLADSRYGAVNYSYGLHNLRTNQRARIHTHMAAVGSPVTITDYENPLFREDVRHNGIMIREGYSLEDALQGFVYSFYFGNSSGRPEQNFTMLLFMTSTAGFASPLLMINPYIVKAVAAITEATIGGDGNTGNVASTGVCTFQGYR